MFSVENPWGRSQNKVKLILYVLYGDKFMFSLQIECLYQNTCKEYRHPLSIFMKIKKKKIYYYLSFKILMTISFFT